MPFPTEEKLLQSVVTLTRIMSKSSESIYRRHHDSLLPLWTAANEVRRDLKAFAEQQRENFNFGLVDDPTAGELGVCQTIVSTCKSDARTKGAKGRRHTRNGRR